MCLLVVAHNAHPRYRLVLATNRDEVYDRPARPAQFWDEAPDLLAGRDIRGGGTWCGVDRRGRFAVVTNYREGHEERPGAPSRGHLVVDYLTDGQKPAVFLETLAGSSLQYNGFNLLAGDMRQIAYHSNRMGRVVVLPDGVYGLSNHLIDTPWPKVRRGKALLREVLAADAVDPEALFALLADATPAPDDELPDTGVGIEWERRLSPIFIAGEAYGTRCSTVLLIDRDGRVDFLERTHYPDHRPPTTVAERFDIQATSDIPRS